MDALKVGRVIVHFRGVFAKQGFLTAAIGLNSITPMLLFAFISLGLLTTGRIAGKVYVMFCYLMDEFDGILRRDAAEFLAVYNSFSNSFCGSGLLLISSRIDVPSTRTRILSDAFSTL